MSESPATHRLSTGYADMSTRRFLDEVDAMAPPAARRVELHESGELMRERHIAQSAGTWHLDRPEDEQGKPGAKAGWAKDRGPGDPRRAEADQNARDVRDLMLYLSMI